MIPEFRLGGPRADQIQQELIGSMMQIAPLAPDHKQVGQGRVWGGIVPLFQSGFDGRGKVCGGMQFH